jgi:protein-L-isoaspartate(D-aspartate) O-methyltransferase
MSIPLATKAALALLLSAAALAASAGGCSAKPAPHAGNAGQPQPHASASDPEYARARERMVRDQIEARGVREPRVLEAMRRVPRHLFVPEAVRSRAYEDYPLPIGHNQTISQPFIVAWMTEALQVTPRSRVLEIGTGSGYQAAVLAEIVAEVYTIEIVAPLAESARRAFEAAGYRNVHAKQGDGYVGWPEHAPFDAVIVTAAPEQVPQPLIDQLRVGGRLVVPVGGRGIQQMTVITKGPAGVTREERMPVRFVPLVRP